MVELRYAELRQPLGLTFTDKDLLADKNDFLLGTFATEQLVACCVLTPINSTTFKLRQMAVDKAFQKMKVGKTMLHFAEQFAIGKNVFTVEMHARLYAKEFYEKCGYSITGDIFEEVNIPHIKMYKLLTPSTH